MKTRPPMINRTHALLLARARFFPPHGAHMPRQAALHLAGSLAHPPLRRGAGQQTSPFPDHFLRDFTHALVERLADPLTGPRNHHGPVTWRVKWHVRRPVSLQFSNRLPAKRPPVT